MSNEQVKTLFQELVAESMQLGMQMVMEDHEQWLEGKNERYESMVQAARKLSLSVRNVIDHLELPLEVSDVLPMLSSMEEAWNYLREDKAMSQPDEMDVQGVV